MIPIHGKVTNATVTYSTSFVTAMECVMRCYGNSSCFLAYFNKSCWHYGYSVENHIDVQESASGDVVAFKTDISTIPNNTCPKSYNDLKFSYTPNVSNTYSWRKSSQGWKFTSCRTNWTRFERIDGSVVCMEAYLFLTGSMEFKDSDVLCKSIDAVLTGIDSIEEYTWARNITPPASNLLLGGERDCPTTPCTTFKWTDGYTTSKTFLNATYVNSKSMNSELVPYNCLATANGNVGSKALTHFSCDQQARGFIVAISFCEE